MKRRKFVAGLGSLAAGSAAAIGTGALTSQSASRNLTVSTASDNQAFLSLIQLDSPHSQTYTDDSGQELVINVDGNSNGGRGINADGHTRLDDLFGVVNKGTQTVYTFIRLIGNGAKTQTYLYDSDNITKAVSPDYGNPGPYADQDEPDPLNPDPSDIEYSARKLSPGEPLRVGLDVEEVNSNIFGQTETIQVVGAVSASQVSNFPPNTHD